MSVRILSGFRINEGEDKTGAVFYDGTDGMAYGPVFKSAEDAERFLGFLGGQDPGELAWGNDDTSIGFRAYREWLEAGKPDKPVGPAPMPEAVRQAMRDANNLLKAQ